MTVISAQLIPRDPVTDTRPVVRVTSLQDRRVTGLANVRWFPAISQLPVQTIRLFDGDFSSDVEPGTAALTIQIDKVLEPNVRRYLWPGAEVTAYRGNAGDAWPWTLCFVGKVTGWEASGNFVKLTCSVDTEPFEADALTRTYAGTGAAEGDANLKGKVKPWLFGRAQNVEPVLINSVDNVYQFSGYGPIQAVTTVFERGSANFISAGDFASYAALLAATIPGGKYGTCLAEGLIRMGAPAYGVITGDVDGHKESGTWLRTTGAIMSCIATRAGVSAGLIDTASLAALDAAMAALPAGGYINLYLTEQTEVLDICRRLARPCNAQVGISWLGKLFAVRVAIGAPAVTLDGQGKRLPQVSQSSELDVSPPYWRIVMGANRVWRVQSYEEISRVFDYSDRGDYLSTEVYRAGNVVKNQTMRWVYVNSAATAGNAPPTLPTSANAWWEAMDPKLAGIESGADVSADIIGPTDIFIECDSGGTPLSGQLDQLFPYKLIELGAQVTSGITWSTTSPSGITAAINGAGTGSLAVTALSANKIGLELSAARSGKQTRKFPVTVWKNIAAAPSGGGTGGGTGGTSQSQNSGFAAVSSGTAAPVSIELQVLVGSVGSVTFAAALTVRPARASPVGNWLIRFQWERWNGASWVTQGSTFDASLASVAIDGDGFYQVDPEGAASNSQTYVSSAGATVKMRLTAWIVPGSSTDTTKPCTLTGQASLVG